MTSTTAPVTPTGVEWTASGPRPVADLDAAFTHGTTEGIVEVRYDYRAELLDFGAGSAESATGLWRYAGLLPPFPGPVTYPLRVGGTALLRPAALARRIGLPNLLVKDETQGPSLSNKDRSTALVVEYARQTGAAAVAAASTGNVAASLAVGAAAVGIPAVIFVPSDVDPGKLMASATTGATIVLVEQGYQAAFALSRQMARRFGWLDRNTGVNPLTIEGKKTVAFEIWEQNGRRFPDTVVAPIGDGVTLYALAKGFAELAACGAPGRQPRIVGVQSSGCAPVASAWRDGGRIEPVQPDTVATGSPSELRCAGRSCSTRSGGPRARSSRSTTPRSSTPCTSWAAPGCSPSRPVPAPTQVCALRSTPASSGATSRWWS
ncbi:hypothetical protein BJF78_19485 [Pseudonocardia sp. CNS-139]|nr:hypothetical protein BJF78_19485 [Pseudonocardia sp. CNS-139]